MIALSARRPPSSAVAATVVRRRRPFRPPRRDPFPSQYHCLPLFPSRFAVRRSSSSSTTLLQTLELPSLNQGGTLTIRGSDRVDLDVLVRTGWRDDARLILERPRREREDGPDDCGGRDSSDDVEVSMVASTGEERTSLGRVFPSVVVDVDAEAVTEKEGRVVPPPPSATLIANVPEKINLNCRLAGHPGRIDVEGKVEGDVDLSVSGRRGGDVIVDKIRGHDVSIRTNGGTIHVKRVVEARDAKLVSTGGGGRVRAKMIVGSSVTVEVGGGERDDDDDDGGEGGSPSDAVVEDDRKFAKLDDDDGLASIDISSLYCAGGGGGSSADDGAFLSVDRSAVGGSADPPATPRSVRVKGHHGHVSVWTKIAPFGDRPADVDFRDEYGGRIPVVELGGANGSFDVAIEEGEGKNEYDDGVVEAGGSGDLGGGGGGSTVAAKIHVDSLSPASASILTSDGGDVGLTIDRKVQADLRLLSTPSPSSLDADLLLDGDADAIRDALRERDSKIASRIDENRRIRKRISVETESFEELDLASSENNPLRHSEYVEGSLENRSKEPDSRFDAKNRGHRRSSDARRGGDGGSVGKIRLEGAAMQALDRFGGGGGGTSEKAVEAEERPLLAVVTDGDIQLETVSWLGAIARRYGMDEGGGGNDPGRRAKAGAATTTTAAPAAAEKRKR